MRLLKFNSINVDIDDNTAIGIDFQAMDFKEPGKRKLSVSNTFTLPKTAKNLGLIGHAGNPQRISKDVYDKIYCDYYINNKQLITKGSVRIDAVSDRISCYVVQKNDIWDNLALEDWTTFQTNLLIWLQENKSIPSASSPFIGTWQAFVESFINTTSSIIMPFYIGNLAWYSPDEVNYLEDFSALWVKYHSSTMDTAALGGHMCCFVKTIFEYIEDTYNVDFLTSDTVTPGNIWLDEIAPTMFTPFRNISIQYYSTTGYYFQTDFSGQFLPEKDVKDKGDKTLLDFVKAFFGHFNILIDKIEVNDGSEKYRLARFDDITEAEVVDFSGKLTGVPQFSPIIQSYNQNNYITFSKIFEGGNSLVNAKKIVCNNKNLDIGTADSVLFSIDAFVPGSFQQGATVVPNLSKSESFSTFEFFVSNGQLSTSVKISQESDTVKTANVTLHVANLYSLASEYLTLASMMLYPELWTIKKWLTIDDIKTLEFFKRYYVRELNGYFFLNKISGFNPDKSKDATTIELIRLPNA